MRFDGGDPLTSAQEDTQVSTSFVSTYDISVRNTADITNTVTFSNVGSLPTILTSYRLNLGDVDPKNLSVEHEGGNILAVPYESSGTVLNINFEETRLRPGEQYSFDVSYEVPNYLSEVGGTYEAVFPVFGEGTEGNVLRMKYPSSFGAVHYTNLSYKFTEDGNFSTLEFTDFGDSDHVYVSIGSYKNFSLDLEHSFYNDEEMYVQKQLILPPDTSSQHIILNSVVPYPDSVDLDENGNYILSYNVPPGKETWVRIRGMINIVNNTEDAHFLAAGERANFVDTNDAWVRITEEDVLSQIDEVDPDLSDAEKIDWIYDYVSQNLTLSENFRELHGFEYRKGANVALKSYKSASAEDYADVFVGIARLMDVPTRVVAGYVFPYSITSDSKGMYHVWPQYWTSDEGWVSVDPAYDEYIGSELRDDVGLNRVVMVISPDTQSDVTLEETSSQIFMTNEDVEISEAMNLDVNIEDSIEAGVDQDGSVIIENSGNTILTHVNLLSENSGVDMRISDVANYDVIMPGSSKEVDFKIKISKWNFIGQKELNFEIVAQTPEGTIREEITKTVSVEQVMWAEPVVWIITLLLFAVSLAVGYFGWGVFERILRGVGLVGNVGQSSSKNPKIKKKN